MPEDSKLQKIEKNAFHCPLLEIITFPSKLKDLEDGWCNEALKLKKKSILCQKTNIL